MFHDVNATKRATEVDGTQDNLRNIAVGNSNRLEDCRAIVEKVVGASKLLNSLEGHAKERPV